MKKQMTREEMDDLALEQEILAREELCEELEELAIMQDLPVDWYL